MNRLLHTWIPYLAALPALVACQLPPRAESLAPTDSVVCYALRYGTWTSPHAHRLAAAPAGLQARLPDTIGLSHGVAKTSYGQALYGVLTVPTDSDHAGAYWLPRGPDSVAVRFPAHFGWVLGLHLGVATDSAGGTAWVAPAVPSDLVQVVPTARVSATPVSCPAALLSSAAGA